MGGYDDWRLATLSEMTTAVAHGLPLNDASGMPNCPLAGVAGTKFLWWSSTTAKGNKAYAVDMRTGISELTLIQSKSGRQVTYSRLYAIFVRQGAPQGTP